MNLDLGLLVIIGIAGGLGSVVRAQLSSWRGALPFGVILTNLLSASFIGLIFTSWQVAPDYQVVALSGFAGGLSTFSGVSQAAWEFWHNGRLVQMLLTLITNLLIPLTALMLVLWLL